MHRIATNLFLLLTALSALMPAPARASEPATAVILFDGSGSMWGTPQGETKPKFIMAREALKQSFTTLPAEARLGLISFGHRRQGDCNDVETIVKAEAGAAELIDGALEKLSPKGRGPITSALKEAAKELGPQSAPASIILIHDDADNCLADPCSTIGELRRAHPKVAIHVVSIAAKREDAQKLQCLARQTGGTQVEVATAQAAAAAIDGILKTAVIDKMRPPAVAKAPPSPPAAMPIAPRAPSDKPGLQLSAALIEGGVFLDAPIRWRVTAADKPNEAPVFEQDAAAPFLALPAGRYAIEAQYGFVVARTSVDYAAGTVRNVVVPLGAGAVRLTGSSDSAPQRSALVTFTRINAPNETAAILRGIAPEVALVPGSYRVSMTSGPTRIERQVTVAAGQRVALDPQLDLGEVEIQVLTGAGGARASGAVVTIYEDDPDAPLGRREIVRSAANGAVFALPAGTYASLARFGGLETRDRFLVKAGEREQRTMVLEIAQLSVAANMPGRLTPDAGPVAIRLEKLDEPKETSQASRLPASFVVPAGRYKVELRVGQGNVAAAREIELKSGAQEQMTLDVPAGALRLRLMEPGRAAATADVAWEVIDRTGRIVWMASLAEATPLLQPGRYTVRADLRGKQATLEVEVRAGEVRAYDLTAP